MNSQETLRLLAQRMPEIRQRFDVQELAFFGSVARDEARPDSDLDVLVTFKGDPTFDKFFGLMIYLEEAFGVKVDLTTRESLRKRLRPSIEREMILVA